MSNPTYFCFALMIAIFYSCQPTNNEIGKHQFEKSTSPPPENYLTSNNMEFTISPNSILLTSKAGSEPYLHTNLPLVWYLDEIPTVFLLNQISINENRKVITLSPILPANIIKAKTDKIAVSNNELEIFYEKAGDEINLKIKQKSADWRINVQYPKGKFTTWVLKGEDNRRTSTDTTDGFSTIGRVISYRLK